MSAPSISIILPVYNGEAHLRETLASVLAQTCQDFEIIIVNDGSTDQSLEVLREFFTDPRFHYLGQTNAGVAQARNTGIRAASGAYIALLDQDDIWKPQKLARQLDYLNQHPQCALAYSQISFIDERSAALPIPSWAWVSPIGENPVETLLQRNRIATFTVLFRKAVIEQIGLFRESFAPCDDWDYWLRIARKFELGFLPEVLGCYRVHGNNASRNQIRMQLAEVRVIENFPQEFPDAMVKIGDRALRQKRFEIYRETAMLLARSQQTSNANVYWKKALQQRPYSFTCYWGVVWNQLPAKWRRTLLWYLRRLTPFIRPGNPA